MPYKTFNSLKEVHGDDYFISRIADEDYVPIEEDKKLNKQFYEVK